MGSTFRENGSAVNPYGGRARSARCSNWQEARWDLTVCHACTASGQACRSWDGVAVTKPACVLELDDDGSWESHACLPRSGASMAHNAGFDFVCNPVALERIAGRRACFLWLIAEGVASCRCATRPLGGRATHVFSCSRRVVCVVILPGGFLGASTWFGRRWLEQEEMSWGGWGWVSNGGQCPPYGVLIAGAGSRGSAGFPAAVRMWTTTSREGSVAR
jgi:hypothetical protein